MLFGITLNLLLYLENGDITLTTITIDGANETSNEKIDKLVEQFKEQFEEQNNTEILKIEYLTQKQAEDFKNHVNNMPTFKKDKFIIILNESITFFNKYLETCCEQLSKIKSKDKNFLVQISFYITNVYYIIQKTQSLKSYISTLKTLTINNEQEFEKIKKDFNFIINFLHKIPHEDYIMFGLQKILKEFELAN